jgi:hypothetical protein
MSLWAEKLNLKFRYHLAKTSVDRSTTLKLILNNYSLSMQTRINFLRIGASVVVKNIMNIWMA